MLSEFLVFLAINGKYHECIKDIKITAFLESDKTIKFKLQDILYRLYYTHWGMCITTGILCRLRIVWSILFNNQNLVTVSLVNIVEYEYYSSLLIVC